MSRRSVTDGSADAGGGANADTGDGSIGGGMGDGEKVCGGGDISVGTVGNGGGGEGG